MSESIYTNTALRFRLVCGNQREGNDTYSTCVHMHLAFCYDLCFLWPDSEAVVVLLVFESNVVFLLFVLLFSC